MGNSTEPVRIERHAGQTRVALDTTLGISEVRALYQQLGRVLSYQAPVVFAADKLERIDGAALQVLAAFCHNARQRGLAVQWRAPSIDLQQAAQWLGLESTLRLTP